MKRWESDRYAQRKYERTWMDVRERTYSEVYTKEYLEKARRRFQQRPSREVDNPQMCSGHCCGNPRRHGYYKNGLTKQEIFANWKLKESIKDFKNPDLTVKGSWDDMHTWEDDYPYGVYEPYPYGWFLDW